jgi:hypothetical protein
MGAKRDCLRAPRLAAESVGGELDPAAIDEAVSGRTTTADLPELDLMIRTRRRSGCRTSCCGRRPMPSCCSSTRYGRTSTKRVPTRRSTNLPAASAGSAADEGTGHPHRGRIILIAIALVERLLGGWSFAVLVALIATIMYRRMVADGLTLGPGWKVYGFFYCLLPAISLLWIRERAEYQGLAAGSTC